MNENEGGKMKYKMGLKCAYCGKQTMTKMQMIQDLLKWSGQKPKSIYANADFTTEQLYWIWRALKGKRIWKK